MLPSKDSVNTCVIGQLMRAKLKQYAERGMCYMSTSLQSDNGIPLLRFWTRRYAGVLIAILIILGMIAGVWIKVNQNKQNFQLLQARAEQLSVSYLRSMELLQSQPSSRQDELSTTPALTVHLLQPYTSYTNRNSASCSSRLYANF